MLHPIFYIRIRVISVIRVLLPSPVTQHSLLLQRATGLLASAIFPSPEKNVDNYLQIY